MAKELVGPEASLLRRWAVLLSLAITRCRVVCQQPIFIVLGFFSPFDREGFHPIASDGICH
jgi:hypothetical protein